MPTGWSSSPTSRPEPPTSDPPGRLGAHAERVAALVLLNTYYGWTKALRRPQAIFLYSTPILRNLARLVASRFEALDRSLYRWQVGRFIHDRAVRAELVPLLYAGFRAARPAFWSLSNDLLGTVISRRKSIPTMRGFSRPVRGTTSRWTSRRRSPV